MANGKRLIDANALITAIQGTASEVARNAPYDPEWFTRLAARQVEILYIIDAMPTVDAVEVVRCMDCTYWKKATANRKGFLICPASGMEIMAVDFCSYGERRDNV